MKHCLLLGRVIGMGLILVLLVACNAQVNERQIEFSLFNLLDPWNLVAITALLILSAILLHLIKPNITGFAGKRLWDWISVLFVPLVLGIGGLLFTKAQLDLQVAQATGEAENAIAQSTATAQSNQTAQAAQTAQSIASAIETEQANINATATRVGADLVAAEAEDDRVEIEKAQANATFQAEVATVTQSAIESVQSAQTAEAIAVFNAQATKDTESNQATLEALKIIPTSTATSTPTLTCSPEPNGEFRDLWTKYQSRLRCPKKAEPSLEDFVEQPFQHGHMYWRPDPKRVYIVYLEIGDDRGDWESISDEYEDGDDYPCPVQTPAGTIRPVRGFGLIWCTEQEVRERLGGALEDEEASDVLIQGFDDGIILRDSDGMAKGEAYVMFGEDQGEFVREQY